MDKQTNNAPLLMGLDAMETGNALDVMMAILPDVAVIMNDPEADALVQQLKGDGIKKVEAGDAFRVLIPLFAKKYKAQFLRIVAACQGVALGEVEKQPLPKTMAVFAASLKTLNGFFVCCLHMARNM